MTPSLPVPPAHVVQPPLLAAELNEQKSQPAATSAGWSYTLEGYAFVPWLNASTTVRGFTTYTNLAPDRILSLLQSAATLRGSVEYDRLGVIADAAYTQLGAARSTTGPRGLLTGRASLTAINGIYDLALRYRFGRPESAIGRPGEWSVIPYAGARVVQAQLGVEAQVQGSGPLAFSWQQQGRLQRTWTQPLLGSQATMFLSPSLRLFARGDLAGFGLAGSQDMSGNAQVGLGYAIGNNTDLNLSWRYQGIAFRNSAARSTGFTSDQNGLEIGVKFFF